MEGIERYNGKIALKERMVEMKDQLNGEIGATNGIYSGRSS